MPLIEREGSDLGSPAAADPVVQLLSDWGLDIGGAVSGWTLDSASVVIDDLEDSPSAAVADFSRDDWLLRVRFRRAGETPCFAQVGEIAISHDPFDGDGHSEVAELLKELATQLEAHDEGAALVPILDAMAAHAPPVRGGPRATMPGSDPGDPDRHIEAFGTPATRKPTAVASAQPYLVVHEAPPLDPAKEAPADRPIIDFEFIHVSDLDKYPNALREIYNGDRGGLVIQGVYSKDEMARVVDRLDGGQDKFPLMHLPPNQGSYFLGLCLEGGDPTLVDYLNSAERFREETLPVFSDMAPFEERIEGIIGTLAGEREVQLARYSDGRAYTPATIRILPDGGQLAPHCGNEMYNRPSYEHLNSFVDNHDQLSYFLTLQEAEEGGGLIIYSLKWNEVGPDHILPDERSNVGALLGEAEWMEVRPTAGDVLIFDGGRYLHRVDWVHGRTRWTMGGFMMFDQSGEKVLYFA